MNGSNWKQFLALLGYARPYKKWVTLQFACMGLSVGMGLLKPWPLKVLVDNVIGDRPFFLGQWRPEISGLWLLAFACLAYLLIHAGDSLIQLLSANVAAFSSSKMIRDLRSVCMTRLQNLSLRYHDQQKVGDLVHRIAYNTAAVETAFQSGFMGSAKSLLTLACLFVVMVLMNPFLTAVALAIAPLLIISIRWYAKRIQHVSRAHQDQEGTVSSLAQEILSSIRLVQAFNRQRIEHDRFATTCECSVQTRLKTTLVQKFFGLSTALILSLGTAILFWAGARQVQSGALTVGEFLVFLSYLAMLYSPLSVLSYTSSSIQSALGGASRLFDILESGDEIVESSDAAPVNPSSEGIHFESVSFGYLPGQMVLRNISFHIAARRVTAIVGETGSGKSTLLNLILRFYDPDGGRLLIGDQDMRKVGIASLRNELGFVPQDLILLSGTIRDNIAYGRPSASQAEIEQAARMAEAHSFIVQSPDQYDTMVGERGVRLSAGQRQRISLARAFLKNPRIYLLDEPTSALDAETESRLLERLTALRGEHTVVFVTHRLLAARACDSIVVLKDGHICEHGAHDDLLNMRGYYYRMWQAQIEGRPAAMADHK